MSKERTHTAQNKNDGILGVSDGVRAVNWRSDVQLYGKVGLFIFGVLLLCGIYYNRIWRSCPEPGPSTDRRLPYSSDVCARWGVDFWVVNPF